MLDCFIINYLQYLGDHSVDPSRSWAAAKRFEKRSCLDLDTLMDMTGLRTVKREALQLYLTICKYVLEIYRLLCNLWLNTF